MSGDFDWSKHLLEGEEVLWQGRPHGGFRPFMSGADILLVPVFSLMFLVGLASLQTTYGVLALVSGYVVLGRPIFDMRHRRALRYAITDRRVLRAHKRLGILTRLEINESLRIDVEVMRRTTIILNRWDQHWIRLHWSVDALGIATSIFRSLFVGHMERGAELRLIADGHKVSGLLKSLKAQNAEAVA
ncbi:MAG: hypothetical protein AAF376_01715 [Pseudomonadota bacterium]